MSSEFQPASPKPASPWLTLPLFLYHVALGLFLAYATYNVWPPQPWPKDPKAATSDQRPAKNDSARSQEPASTATDTTPSQTDTTPSTTDTTATGIVSPEAGASPANGSAGKSSGTDGVEKFPPEFKLFGCPFNPPLETRLILLVLLVGAIGSYVHATSSFVDYLGNRTFISSWGWWYLLRPFIGMMLALLFYFVFRAGFVTAGTNNASDAAASFINPFGIAALAGLVGMFSKAATDKLNEVFQTIFKPENGDAKRKDKLAAGKPTLTAIEPHKGPAAGGTPVTITGTGFTEGAEVTFGGVAAKPVTFTGSTSLKAVTPAHAAGVVEVTVTNPDKQSVVLKNGFTYE